MSKPFIVGLSGYAGSGKDTVAKYLSKELGTLGISNFSYAFAKPLKMMSLTLLNYLGGKYEWLEDRTLKETLIEGVDFTPRKLMQLMGTQIGRELDVNLWIKIAGKVRQTVGDVQGKQVMIVTDVRFENEAAWVRENGGVVVHIDRPDVAPKLSFSKKMLVKLGLGEWILHASERGVKRQENDEVILNDDTFKELEFSVFLLAQGLKDRIKRKGTRDD